MPPRDRRGAQLSIELEPALLARIKAEATRQGRPVSALVRRWLEAGLAGESEPPAAGDALLARVEALEQALAQLQRPASPERVNPAPQASEQQAPARAPQGTGQLEITGAARPRPPALPPAPLPPFLLEVPPDGITTTELADATKTNRRAWNNWASQPGRVGRVRTHPQAGAWRLVGKVPGVTGGPTRWLWQRA